MTTVALGPMPSDTATPDIITYYTYIHIHNLIDLIYLKSIYILYICCRVVTLTRSLYVITSKHTFVSESG
jgi:hypothetical protein